MDKNGTQLHGGTPLQDLLFPAEYVMQVVVLSSIDNQQLGAALDQAGVSPNNVGVNNTVKQA